MFCLSLSIHGENPSSLSACSHSPQAPNPSGPHPAPKLRAAHVLPGFHLFLDLTAQEHLKCKVSKTGLSSLTKLASQPTPLSVKVSACTWLSAPGTQSRPFSVLSLPFHCLLFHLLNLLSVRLSLPPPQPLPLQLLSPSITPHLVALFSGLPSHLTTHQFLLSSSFSPQGICTC